MNTKDCFVDLNVYIYTYKDAEKKMKKKIKDAESSCKIEPALNLS